MENLIPVKLNTYFLRLNIHRALEPPRESKTKMQGLQKRKVFSQCDDCDVWKQDYNK